MIVLTESEKLRLNEIIKKFNFNRVYKCMNGMNWEWGSSKGVPTIIEIKKSAKSLLISAIEHIRKKESVRIGTGGFQVEYSKEVDLLELSFVVSAWDDEDITKNSKYLKTLKKEKRQQYIKKILN